MEDVVKYICMNYDYQHALQNKFPNKLTCTYDLGLSCVGISGYMLNYGLSFFLSYNVYPDEGVVYRIHWVCDDSVLFPAIVCQSNGKKYRYVGTLPNESGILKIKDIKREQCTDMPHTCLKLKNCTQGIEQEIIKFGALLQDRFRLSRNSYSPARHVALMCVSKIVRTGSADKKTVSSAKNCLLLFFAPDTIKSLRDFAMHTTDIKELSLLLEFLSRYCVFILGLVQKCRNESVYVPTFAECFEEYWEINIRTVLREIIQPRIKSYEYDLVSIPKNPSTVQLQSMLWDCIEAGTYEQRTRPMQQIYLHIQKHCVTPDAKSRLVDVNNYLCTMQEMCKQRGQYTR